jgi:uncharacterized protein
MGVGQPYFRFYPRAYEPDGPFECSNDICEVCQNPCGWKYTGGIYAETEPVICAVCIAGDKLAQFLGHREFSYHDVALDNSDPLLEAEVLQRTPGVACFNPFVWPVVDGMPLAFICAGDDPEIISNPLVQEATRKAYKDCDWEYEAGSPASYALIFKEIDHERYQAIIDMD